MVNEMVDLDNNWAWHQLSLWLDHSLLSRVASILPPKVTDGDDRISWRWKKDGRSSVSDAYDQLNNLKISFGQSCGT